MSTMTTRKIRQHLRQQYSAPTPPAAKILGTPMTPLEATSIKSISINSYYYIIILTW